MRNLFVFFAGILLVSTFSSCKLEKTVCPAYQSAFIYDKDELTKRFSYFGEDTLPKVFEASKDKFLIIEKVPYKKKLRSLATIEMKPIYPVISDSVAFAGDVDQYSELDVLDSALLDSMSLLPPWEEKFNIEQENYLYYFNEILVYPDERAALEAADRKMKEIEAEHGVGEEKKGFFKRLFGKKNKGDEPGELKDSLIGDEEGDTLEESQEAVGEDGEAVEGEEAPEAGKRKKKKKKKKKKKVNVDSELGGDGADTGEAAAAKPPKKKKEKKKKDKKKKKKKDDSDDGVETEIPPTEDDEEGGF